MAQLSFEELDLVRKSVVPRHVAVIMDGNRRWAKKQLLKRAWGGHWQGAETLTNLVEGAQDIGIEVLTAYAFSTENWSRSQKEIDTLITIFETYLKQQRQRMVEKGVRFHVIGDLAPFPDSMRYEVEETQAATKAGEGIDFVIAMNYGGRAEICRAATALLQSGVEEVSEELLAEQLYTAPFGDPDLLVRTSGERRISNFLLWQIAYSEIYVTDTLWPDFTPRDLMNAVLDFQKRKRRLGK